MGSGRRGVRDRGAGGRWAFALGALAVVAPFVAAQPAPSELDLRAAMALHNADRPRAQWIELAAVTPKHVTDLPNRPDPGATKNLTYGARYGGPTPKQAGVGSYRITLAPGESDLARSGWTLITRYPTPETELWRKAAEDLDQYVLRGLEGGVRLGVTELRTRGEPVDAVATDLMTRYRRLLEAAQHAGLMLRIRVTWLTGDGSRPLGGSPPALTLGPTDFTLRARIEILAGDGSAVPPRWLRVKVGGLLAPWVTLPGVPYDAANREARIETPGAPYDLVVGIPAETDASAKALFDAAESGASPLDLTVSGRPQ